jgi:hypothetical protein
MAESGTIVSEPVLTAEPDDAEPWPVLAREFSDALTAELAASALPEPDEVEPAVAVGLALGVDVDGDEPVDVPELADPPPALGPPELRSTQEAPALPTGWLARVAVGKAGLIEIVWLAFVNTAVVAVGEFELRDASAEVEAVW